MPNFLKYSIIIPAHNEQKFIAQTLDSILNQTYLPNQLIVVNDNSNDSTKEIVEGYVKIHPFIKLVNTENSDDRHLPGSKIIEAFYKGFAELDQEWDIISKLDADVVLPTNYFEKIIEEFHKNENLAIVGGIGFVLKNQEWIVEKFGDKNHVRGPFKSYSKKYFSKVVGIKKSIAWDTVDELLAMYHGFDVKVIADLEVKLLKPTGNDYKKIHGTKTGEGFYKMDYNWIISLIATLKAVWNSQNPNLFFSISKGYWKSVYRNDNKIVTKEEGRFIRRFRWGKILKRFLNHT